MVITRSAMAVTAADELHEPGTRILRLGSSPSRARARKRIRLVGEAAWVGLRVAQLPYVRERVIETTFVPTLYPRPGCELLL